MQPDSKRRGIHLPLNISDSHRQSGRELKRQNWRMMDMNSCFSHVRPRLADMKDLAGIAALEMAVF